MSSKNGFRQYRLAAFPKFLAVSVALNKFFVSVFKLNEAKRVDAQNVGQTLTPDYAFLVLAANVLTTYFTQGKQLKKMANIDFDDKGFKAYGSVEQHELAKATVLGTVLDLKGKQLDEFIAARQAHILGSAVTPVHTASKTHEAISQLIQIKNPKARPLLSNQAQAMKHPLGFDQKISYYFDLNRQLFELKQALRKKPEDHSVTIEAHNQAFRIHYRHRADEALFLALAQQIEQAVALEQSQKMDVKSLVKGEKQYLNELQTLVNHERYMAYQIEKFQLDIGRLDKVALRRYVGTQVSDAQLTQILSASLNQRKEEDRLDQNLAAAYCGSEISAKKKIETYLEKCKAIRKKREERLIKLWSWESFFRGLSFSVDHANAIQFAFVTSIATFGILSVLLFPLWLNFPITVLIAFAIWKSNRNYGKTRIRPMLNNIGFLFDYSSTVTKHTTKKQKAIYITTALFCVVSLPFYFHVFFLLTHAVALGAFLSMLLTIFAGLVIGLSAIANYVLTTESFFKKENSVVLSFEQAKHEKKIANFLSTNFVTLLILLLGILITALGNYAAFVAMSLPLPITLFGVGLIVSGSFMFKYKDTKEGMQKIMTSIFGQQGVQKKLTIFKVALFFLTTIIVLTLSLTLPPTVLLLPAVLSFAVPFIGKTMATVSLYLAGSMVFGKLIEKIVGPRAKLKEPSPPGTEVLVPESPPATNTVSPLAKVHRSPLASPPKHNRPSQQDSAPTAQYIANRA